MISRGFFIILIVFVIIILFIYQNYNISLYVKNDSINGQEQSYLLNKDKEIVYLDSYNITEEEKFITYLPHSGFHNQRISVENAIFLAWHLNRTLILPPLMFFNGIPPFGMAPFDQLSQRLSQLKPNQNNFTECDLEGKHCITANYTLYHWEELMSMKWVKQHVKIVHRTDFFDKNLLNTLNIKEQEIYYTKCNVRYHHRYYDYLNSTIGLDEFEKRIDLAKLKDRKEKLFYLGSLYSTRRVVRELPESIAFWSKLIREFVPDNPIITKIVNNIVKKIGGERNFLGVHARLGNEFRGDNIFKGAANKTIESFILKISNDYKEYENTFNFGKSTEVANQIRQTILTSTKLIENKEISFFERCSSKFTNDTLPMIIFLATDAKRTHKSLKLFLEKFPCVFMLKDFEEDCKPLNSLENPLDNVKMYKHLIPLVDLMVSSKGSRFYGTPFSTFSLYAMRLNTLLNTFDN